MVEHVSDFKMPEKVVTRLLKDALPEDVTVSKEAKNVACRSASVFILHLSIIAAEKAQSNRRRTLDNKDIIEAAAELGLSEYASQLVRFGAQRKRNAKRKETNIQKSKSKRASGNHPDQGSTMNATPDVNNTSNANISENNLEEADMTQADDEQPDETIGHDETTASSRDEGDHQAEEDEHNDTND